MSDAPGSIVWQERPVPLRALAQLQQDGIEPVLARVLASRGVTGAGQIEPQLNQLLDPQGLTDIERAANLILTALAQKQAILIVADYDCDGATACAVAIRGLNMLGASPGQVQYLVPDRVKFGYGLSPELAIEALKFGPQLLITVDNGIASVEGVQIVRAAGCEVLVTDHHLPGPKLASATAIVNPNQPGCRFASKALAGVGAIFYVLLAARAQLRLAALPCADAPLQQLLDLVALGTVADLVPLDLNNRILVSAGIKRMRANQAQVGLKALFSVAGRVPTDIGTRDIGFTLAPRVNAAGRLDDMSVGIELLITDDPERAANLAQALNEINEERKQVQASMLEQAALPSVQPQSHSLVVSNPEWHQGVVGLVASRLKDQWRLPVFALAPAQNDALEWRGSGRSIPGVHLRDCLDWVAKQFPDVMTRFGGHAMAAGVTVRANAAKLFGEALNQAVQAIYGTGSLSLTQWHDGQLTAADLELDLAIRLASMHWGQRFETPVFKVQATVLEQTVIKEKHLKCRLDIQGKSIRAMRFFSTELLPRNTQLLVALMADEFQGQRALTLNIAAVA
jgi:single-stranded-DNA-specific exonuclease